MSSEFIGTVNATRPKYEKGASDNTIRNRFLLSRLRQAGRILYNESGEELRWQVKYSLPAVETFGEGGTMNFANHDSLRKLSVDWRGYKATDSMGLKSSMMNMGDEALLKLFNVKQENLREAIDNGRRLSWLAKFIVPPSPNVSTLGSEYFTCQRQSSPDWL